LPLAEVKNYRENYRDDDESGSASEDDGAYVGSVENAKILVASDSDEDDDAQED
jgi:hypothetical protein